MSWVQFKGHISEKMTDFGGGFFSRWRVFFRDYVDRYAFIGFISGASLLILSLFIGGFFIGFSIFSFDEHGGLKDQQHDHVETLMDDSPSLLADKNAQKDSSSAVINQSVSEEKINELFHGASNGLASVTSSVLPSSSLPSKQKTLSPIQKIHPSKQKTLSFAQKTPLKEKIQVSDSSEEKKKVKTKIKKDLLQVKKSENPSAFPYAIQAGAFKVKNNALDYRDSLLKLGRSVHIIARGSQKVWYFVRLGAYHEIGQAKKDLENLKKRYGIKGFVIRPEPGERILTLEKGQKQNKSISLN